MKNDPAYCIYYILWIENETFIVMVETHGDPRRLWDGGVIDEITAVSAGEAKEMARRGPLGSIVRRNLYRRQSDGRPECHEAIRPGRDSRNGDVRFRVQVFEPGSVPGSLKSGDFFNRSEETEEPSWPTFYFPRFCLFLR